MFSVFVRSKGRPHVQVPRHRIPPLHPPPLSSCGRSIFALSGPPFHQGKAGLQPSSVPASPSFVVRHDHHPSNSPLPRSRRPCWAYKPCCRCSRSDEDGGERRSYLSSCPYDLQGTLPWSSCTLGTDWRRHVRFHFEWPGGRPGIWTCLRVEGRRIGNPFGIPPRRWVFVGGRMWRGLGHRGRLRARKHLRTLARDSCPEPCHPRLHPPHLVLSSRAVCERGWVEGQEGSDGWSL